MVRVVRIAFASRTRGEQAGMSAAPPMSAWPTALQLCLRSVLQVLEAGGGISEFATAAP